VLFIEYDGVIQSSLVHILRTCLIFPYAEIRPHRFQDFMETIFINMIRLRQLVTEITLGGVTPYVTQFTWSRTTDGESRETVFQADGHRITLAMVYQGRHQWAFAILTPTQDGEGVTVAHDKSAAAGQVNYLRLMSTVTEALIDFATQWQPASINITGSDTANVRKDAQKTRIYRALLAANASRVSTAGYRVLDTNSRLWLVRANLYSGKTMSSA